MKKLQFIDVMIRVSPKFNSCENYGCINILSRTSSKLDCHSIRNQMKKYAAFSAIFSLILTSINAHAVSISLLAGVNADAPSFTQNSTSSITVTSSSASANASFTGGVLLGFDLSASLSFETGLTYLPRAYSETITGLSGLNSYTASVNESVTMLHIPFLLRVNPNSIFSFGAGGYYARGIGDVSDNNGSLTLGGSTTSIPNSVNSFEYEQYNRNDFGLEGSINVRIPMSAGLAFLIDIRFLYGLTNIGAGSSESLSYRDIMALGGFQFGI